MDGICDGENIIKIDKLRLSRLKIIHSIVPQHSGTCEPILEKKLSDSLDLHEEQLASFRNMKNVCSSKLLALPH